MFGRTYIEKNKDLDLYRKMYPFLNFTIFSSCFEAHQKKLNKIKQKNLQKNIKDVEEVMKRRNQN